MAIVITQKDFALIGQLAIHCDKEKLKIATEESIIFDFEPLLCENFFEVSDNWDSFDTIWKDLVCGSDYIGCSDRKMRHLGLKRMMLYYIYARYTVLNGYNDTPNGNVTKTNNFSIPKPLKEVEQFSDKYRSQGYSVWKGIKKYLCNSKDLYPTLKINDCEECDCGGTDCNDKSVKGYGIKGSNISK